MRRRECITLLGSGAATLPLAALAQQRNEKQQVAVLMGGLAFGEADGQAETAAFEDGLKELGWKSGDNINLDYRWPGAELSQVTVAANEIVNMRPNLVVSRSTPATAAIVNRGIPVVFVLVADPIGSGFSTEFGAPGR